MSPNFPDSYPINIKESWLLTAPIGSIIILDFVFFKVRLYFKIRAETSKNFKLI